MTHASVFSGIGGPEVAAEMLGWENLFHCEINPFGRAVLDYWFPNSKSYEDITTTDFSEWGGKVNVLTGGFPCQPFSYAGQRRGSDDDRYLWPYMHKCIDQIRPDWVVCENVAGILTMVEQGDVTEMATEKSLFDEGDTLHRYRLEETFTLERICNDLESDGYAVQAVVIPACAVNAPHRRDRVFIIGHRNDVTDTDCAGQPTSNGQGGQTRETMDGKCQSKSFNGIERFRTPRSATHTDCRGERTPRKGDGTESNGCDQDKLTGQRGAETKRVDRLHAVLRPVADPDCNRGSEVDEHLQPRLADGAKPVCNGRERDVADTVGGRISGCSDNGEQCDEGHHRQHQSSGQPFGIRHQQGWVFDGWCDSDCAGLQRWADFPTVSPVHRGNDGLPFSLDDLTIPASKWRTESLKAYGNAIVPQVMYEIFRAIESTYQ